MILSMTGFASKTIAITLPDGAKLNVLLNIKSLNSRFFETTCKLPYALANLETEFIKIFKKKLVRGHIYFTIHMAGQELLKSSVEPALPVVKGYIKSIELIQKQFNLNGSLTIDALLTLPNIFIAQETELNAPAITLIFDTTQKLLQELHAARHDEGAALKNDLDQRISLMEQIIDHIQQATTVLVEEQKKKIIDALKLIENDESKMALERKDALYMLLDKMDIHEEIVRFKSHLKSLKDQLESPELEKGKRLDFTLQEMGREINTIAAKCADAAISKHAINIKVELEKAREQTQNIV